MKKTLITLVTFMVFITLGYARTNLVATLSHNGQITQFYGTNALTSAYNAAVDGDIITLSPGEFTFSGKFEKGITLRGTGIETSHDTYDAAKPYLTHITSFVSFYSKDSNRVTIVEGIRFTNGVYIYNTSSDKGQGTIKFIKNCFSSTVYASSNFTETPPNSPVVRFYNNLIGSVYFSSYTNPDFKFYNCVIGSPWNAGVGENSSAFYNCIITYHGVDSRYNEPPLRKTDYFNFYNCIFCNLNTSSSWNSDGTLSSTSSCSNCLCVSINGGLFSSVFFNQNNKYKNNIADVFQTYTGNSWHETFELTETAKTTYLGNDGTEIGIQGGVYPYNIKVQYPIITNLSSDDQTTKDGKLNVKIEIDGK